MTAIVLRGDAAHLPLPDASVDLIVTSPPYFGLRSYTDGGEHYQGQIGSEATPAEFIAALIDCTREWVRVLKPSGSLFVNLGDKYSLNNRGSGYAREGIKGRELSDKPQMKRVLPLPEKCLLGLPWRYALACTDQLGLILRAEIVWAKPNGLPESVTDRVRRSHEQLFHFTVRPRYFAAVDEIREAHAEASLKRAMPHRSPPGLASREGRSTNGTGMPANTLRLDQMNNPLGKLPGSVWTIPSAPLKVPAHLGIDHFAAFPPALVRPIVLGWSPAGICTACGEGRRPVRQYEDDVAGYFGEPIEVRRTEPSDEVVRRIGQFIHDHRMRAGRSNSFDVTEEVTDRRTGAVANWEKGLSLPTPEHWRRLKTALGLPDTWDGLMLDTVLRPSVNGKFLGGLDRHVSAAAAKSQRSPGKHITGHACACGSTASCSVCVCLHHLAYHPDGPCEVSGCDCRQFVLLGQTKLPPTRPAVVLDPFGGTGTTALVATVHGRTGITVDMSADYCRLAAWRTRDPAERARALDVPKPPPVPDGMEPLFATP